MVGMVKGNETQNWIDDVRHAENKAHNALLKQHVL